MDSITGWLTGASREQKRTLLAASLGWMLDSMDVMLYALVLGQVQRELHLSAALSGAMVSATLIAAAAGGVGFGWRDHSILVGGNPWRRGWGDRVVVRPGYVPERHMEQHGWVPERHGGEEHRGGEEHHGGEEHRDHR